MQLPQVHHTCVSATDCQHVEVQWHRQPVMMMATASADLLLHMMSGLGVCIAVTQFLVCIVIEYMTPCVLKMF